MSDFWILVLSEQYAVLQYATENLRSTISTHFIGHCWCSTHIQLQWKR